MNYKFDELSEVGKHIICSATSELFDEFHSVKGLDIELFINGVDCSSLYDNLSESISNQIDRLVEERAKVLVSEKYGNLIRKLSDAQSKLFPEDWE